MRKLSKKSYASGAILFSLGFVALCIFSLFCLPAGRSDSLPSAVAAPVSTHQTYGELMHIVRPDTECTYRYFDYPTAVFAENDTVVVADGTTPYAFTSHGTALPLEKEIPQNTTKMTVYGGKYVTLSDGMLYVENPDSKAYEEIGRAVDYVFAGDNRLYFIDGTTQAIRYLDPNVEAAETQTFATNGKLPKHITADKTGIYISCASSYDVYCDDVTYYPLTPDGLGSGTVCLTKTEEILGMDGLTAGGIACFTRDTVATFAPISTSTRRLKQTHEYACSDVKAISTDGNAVYGLSTAKSVFRIDADFHARTEILASAHDADGFFRSNAGIATRKQHIAIADERNNRVQIFDAKGGVQSIRDLRNPKAVAIDYLGNYYIAHDGNKIDMYNDDLVYVNRTAEFAADVQITDLKIDSDNNLYALDVDGSVYAVTDKLTCIAQDAVAIATAQNHKALFIATSERRMTEFDADASDPQDALSEMFAFGADIVDFCTDHNTDFYLLTSNGSIVKYSHNNNGNYKAEGTPVVTFVYATRIAMNTVAASSLSLTYGDLLVSDTGAHAVWAVSGAEFFVNHGFFDPTPGEDEQDAEFKDPVEVHPENPSTPSHSLIFRAHECDVYKHDAEIETIAALPEGMRVIVPQYNPSAKFTRIIADNLSDSKGAIVGYVYTALLTEIGFNENGYTGKQHPVSAYTIAPNVSIYKYPSRSLPALLTFEDKTVPLTVCDFVTHDDANGNPLYGYVDNFVKSKIWYRVQYTHGGVTYEGYVQNDFISMRGDAQAYDRNVYPRVNAKIISKDKNNKELPAWLYEKDEKGEIVPIEDSFYKPLEVGTGVEVVGAFDSSEKYTKIRYYHDGFGTVEVYVETANLRYDGINKVMIVAIVLIILTVILGIVLIVRFLHGKRNRKANAKI